MLAHHTHTRTLAYTRAHTHTHTHSSTYTHTHIHTRKHTHTLHKRRYLYSSDNYVVAGALLAIGIVNCGVQNENDPAFALIYDYVGHEDTNIRYYEYDDDSLVLYTIILGRRT